MKEHIDTKRKMNTRIGTTQNTHKSMGRKVENTGYYSPLLCTVAARTARSSENW